MGTSDKLWIDKLKQEKASFAEILALSQRQLVLFRNGHKSDEDVIEGFNALIDQRQILMDTIDVLQSSSGEKVTPELRGNPVYQELNHDIQSLLDSIRGNDSVIIAEAQQVLHNYGDRINEARNNKRAYQAYNGEDNTGKGWFIDRRK